MGISIVICCYNSSQRLEETIRHIAAQVVDGFYWEIVLVDNASTDDTVQVATRLLAEYCTAVPFRVIQELNRGVAYARETGVRNAVYDLIVFCDDDNWLIPGYIQKAYEIMSSDTRIGICGAAGEAVFEGSPPDWFEKYKMVFACGEQSGYDGEQGIDQMAFYSAGMVVRKRVYEILEEQKYEFYLKGRKGKRVTGGEDYEVAVLARALGYKLYYSSALKFRHYMPAQRLNWRKLVDTVYGSALGSAVIYVYADTLRYELTGRAKFKVSWMKDIVKAIYGAFLMKVSSFRDLQVFWARLSGSFVSVVTNIPRYREYEQKLKRLYELAHKGVQK